MRRLKLLIVFGFMSLALTAQDIHFSQFYMAPLDLNPAMTGLMNCSQRLSGNYRNQWASVLRGNAFQTYNVAYDVRIPVGRYDYIGVGGNLWSDVAGSLSFRTTQLKGAFSYSKRMGGYRKKSHYLVMGADIGIGQRAIDLSKAQFGDQVSRTNPGSIGTDPTADVIFQRDNYIYPDISAGLMWFSVFDENNNFYIGGAYDHINRPNISFTNERFVALPSKFTIHGGGEFQINERMTLLPGALVFLQSPYMQINGGTSLRFLMGGTKRSTEALQFGLWTRLGNQAAASDGTGGGLLMDALILSTRFDYQNFALGFSYDLNMSSLRAASRSNGGFEFALQYKICGPERRNVYCPNF
ncbi:MAG: PorP/SprF family type IX secretion system membrane protein [Saprospiraceae bacterium]|nr:PorP/SprF family type IX secretion system membrane protein [Saprospiraceae bacterium]